MAYLGTFEIPVDKLRTHPDNPNEGDVPGIAESLRKNTQFQAICVQADDPDDPHAGGVILAGNHTYLAARSNGWATIRAELHDLDEQAQLRVMLAANALAKRGVLDDRLLAEVLSQVDDLAGTGYDEHDLDSLVRSLEPPDLDDIAADVGEVKPDDGWPSITMRVPHTVKAAWNAHLSTHSDDPAQAMASLLGVEAY